MPSICHMDACMKSIVCERPGLTAVCLSAQVPKAWQGDSASVLFICRVHRGLTPRSAARFGNLLIRVCSGYFFRMDELSTSNDDLIKHSQYLEEEQLNLKVTYALAYNALI